MFVKITVAFCAVIAVSSAFIVSLESGKDCGQNVDVTPSRSAVITTSGGITNGKCEVDIVADASVDKMCKLCVRVTDWSKMTQCNGQVEFTAQLKTGGTEKLSYPCQPPTSNSQLPAMKCFDATKVTAAVTDVDTSAWSSSFGANVEVDCGSHTPGAHSEPMDDVEFENIKEAVHANRVAGIVVGVCLCCVFLIVLAITYFYYKNKPYSSVPKEP